MFVHERMIVSGVTDAGDFLGSTVRYSFVRRVSKCFKPRRNPDASDPKYRLGLIHVPNTLGLYNFKLQVGLCLKKTSKAILDFDLLTLKTRSVFT